MDSIVFEKRRRVLSVLLIASFFVSTVATAQPSEPVNPNASPEVRRLLKLFASIYGKKILSGQSETSGSSAETQYVKSQTGKEPALRDFDFINYTGNERGDVDLALEWGKRGGLVTFQWHWYAPVGGHSFRPKTAQWPNGTTFDFTKAMDSGTVEHRETLKHLDKVAVQIKRLSNANIPLLFRPLHEAEGKWFWWGVRGPEACKNFWRYIYHYYTDHHKLNNIIWVWNQNTNPDFNWYPGDSVVDILSTDIYKKQHDYGSWISEFKVLSDYITGKKFIALTENGPIPDPDNCIKDKAGWLWFATWWGDFIHSGYISTTQLKKVYNHDYVVTLDEMPALWANVGTLTNDLAREPSGTALRPRVYAKGAGLRIPVVVSNGGDARLVVYDPAGKIVRDIVFRNLPAGGTDIQWDGSDGRGNAVAPGAYLCTVKGASIAASSIAMISITRY